MTDRLASLALGISTSVTLSLLVKATAILVFGLLLVRMMRTTRASRRFVVLAWVFALLAVLPVAVRFGPALPVVVRETRDVAPAPAVTSPAEAGHDVGVATAATRDLTRAQLGTVQPEPTSGDRAAAFVAVMYAAGVVLSLIPVVMTLYRLRTLRRTARAWSRDGTDRAHGARVLVHDQLAAPMTFGWLRSIVLMPADAETWSTADVQRALAHELEHVRRRDWPVHVLARSVCAFYWCHPLVWRAWHRLHLEADRACDDAVVSCSEAREFAEQLVTLAGRVVPSVATPVLSMTGGNLVTRVDALLNPHQARGRSGAGVAVATAAVAVALGATVAAVQAVNVTMFEGAFEPPRTTGDRVQSLPLALAAPQHALASAQQTNRPTPTAPAGAPATKPAVPAQNPAAATPPARYVIGPGDVLTITYWREKDMAGDYIVRPDGKISLPLINDIDAAGLTPEQLRDRLTAASVRFLADPAITVGVKMINSRKVYIIGGVQRPGSYDLLGPMTVLQLLSVAGGLRELVDGRNITIIRQEGGNQTVFKFNYRDVQTGDSLGQNIDLKPGDTVMVSE